jgi:predicted nucleic acid-binding protein
MTVSALLDTNVLYPAYLRDSLLRLADAGLYRPLWSVDILVELRRNLIGTAALAESAVARTIALMNTHFDDAEVTGYSELVEVMTCDAKDRHVLAAAVHAHADVLVTNNTRDFPPASMADYAVELVTADDFLLDLLDLAPVEVLTTLAVQAARYKHEPRTLSGLLGALQAAQVPRFADEIRRMTIGHNYRFPLG